MVDAKPIPFTAPMVRAILEGRKSMTRRVIKLPTKGEYVRPDMGGWKPSILGGGGCFRISKEGTRIPVAEHPVIWNQTTGTCVGMTYEVGDHLWVREAWRAPATMDNLSPSKIVASCQEAYPTPWCPIQWKADTTKTNWADEWRDVKPGRLRAGMHLPRAFSRIMLKVTAVKVERLQDISEADCLAEGAKVVGHHSVGPRSQVGSGKNLEGVMVETDMPFVSATPRAWYRELWDTINGPGSWDKNPWVAAYSFEEVT